MNESAYPTANHSLMLSAERPQRSRHCETAVVCGEVAAPQYRRLDEKLNEHRFSQEIF